MLLIDSITWIRASLLTLLASLAPPAGEGPPELGDPAAPQDAPGDEGLSIKEIKTGGPGCPDEGSVSVVIGDDKQSFVVIYDRMELSNPNDQGKLVQKLNCVAALKLHIPASKKVALATVNTRGYVYLDEDIKATQTSQYFFAGEPLSFKPSSDFVGPYEDYYDISDMIPLDLLAWSSCKEDQILSINSILTLNAKDNPDGTAVFSNQTQDGMFRQELIWMVKDCAE